MSKKGGIMDFWFQNYNLPRVIQINLYFPYEVPYHKLNPNLHFDENITEIINSIKNEVKNYEY